MNKTDVINQVSEKTGRSFQDCETIMKAFEKVSEEALAAKFKGNPLTPEIQLARIAELSGLAVEVCEPVIVQLNETLDTGLSNKLRFFK